MDMAAPHVSARLAGFFIMVLSAPAGIYYHDSFFLSVVHSFWLAGGFCDVAFIPGSLGRIWDYWLCGIMLWPIAASVVQMDRNCVYVFLQKRWRRGRGGEEEGARSCPLFCLRKGEEGGKSLVFSSKKQRKWKNLEGFPQLYGEV